MPYLARSDPIDRETLRRSSDGGDLSLAHDNRRFAAHHAQKDAGVALRNAVPYSRNAARSAHLFGLSTGLPSASYCLPTRRVPTVWRRTARTVAHPAGVLTSVRALPALIEARRRRARKLSAIGLSSVELFANARPFR